MFWSDLSCVRKKKDAEPAPVGHFTEIDPWTKHFHAINHLFCIMKEPLSTPVTELSSFLLS